MQCHLYCSGCRSILLYPRGASSVCCALCNTVTLVSPPGVEMDQLICGGCQMLLMYANGASTVRCSCCNTLNLSPASNQIAHINCGNCRTVLMYPYGAPSVKCAICHFVTSVANSFPVSMQRRQQQQQEPTSMPSSSQSHTQTVVIENPMSVDASGKLVTNVVIGVITEMK